MKHPKLLSSGANNMVIALNGTEVAKLFTGDTRSDIGSEAEKMQYANTINDLVVKYIRLDYHEELQAEMLVMERIYPIDFRAHEVTKRELWLDVFRDELAQLHRAGFVHRNILRPSDIKGQPYDNVLLTDTGLRLIDVGISAIREKVGDLLFQKYLETERKELEEFATYFLNRQEVIKATSLLNSQEMTWGMGLRGVCECTHAYAPFSPMPYAISRPPSTS